jgi:hypothetical protein
MQSFCVVSLRLYRKVFSDCSSNLCELHHSKQVIPWVCGAQRNTQTSYKWHFLFVSRTILLTMENTYTEHFLLSIEQANMAATVTLFARHPGETSCCVISFPWLNNLSGARSLHYRRFEITIKTHVTRYDSSRRRDLCLTTHSTYKRHISMLSAWFEPTILASQRPQTHAIDRAATGMDKVVT